MSTPILISLASLVLILLLAYMFSSKKGNKQVESSEPLNTEDVFVADEFKEIYERGLNPTEYAESTFYTLTHCVHCVRLEKYLEKNSIPFTKVLLDNFEGAARKIMLDKVRSYNPRGSFPTLVSPKEDVTVGFREWQVREKFMQYSTNSQVLEEWEKENNKDASNSSSQEVVQEEKEAENAVQEEVVNTIDRQQEEDTKEGNKE